MYVWVYSFLILTYIMNQLFPTSVLAYTVGIAATISLVISYRKASGLYFFTGLFFLISGCTLFLYFGLPFHTFFLHFQTMMGLLSFFFVLPFIQSLIQTGHFDNQLNRFLNLQTTRLSQLYRRSSLVSHILGIFLNVATAPLLVKSLDLSLTSVQDGIKNRFYASSLLRSYALCLTWNPLEALVGISIDATKIRYFWIFPITLLLAILFLIVDWVLYAKGKSSNLPILATDLTISKMKKLKKKMLQLIGILFIFTMVVSFVDYWTGYGFLFSIVLVTIPFSLTSAFLMKKRKQYVTIAIPHWKKRVESLPNHFFMFLSAGFFVEMASQTTWVLKIQTFLTGYIDHVFLFYLLIGMYFVVTALVGFHPIVSFALILKILEQVIEHLSPLPLALVLISCSIAPAMYSPYNISVSLLSSEMKVNPYRVTQWNLGFALCYMLVSISIAYYIDLFGYPVPQYP